MRLTSPSFPVFIISVVLFALVVVARYLGITIPVVSGNVFEILLVAYVVMLVYWFAAPEPHSGLVFWLTVSIGTPVSA